MPTRRHVLKWAAAAVVGSAVSGRAATSQPATARAVADVSDLVRRIRGDDRVPGLWGAVVDTKGVNALGADGWRKTGANVRVTPRDQVHLGSCTKAMTATLIGRLVQAGKLTLDRTLAECFPDLAAGADPTLAAVTVRQLLDHRSGLRANVDWHRLDGTAAPLRQKRRTIVADVFRQPPSQPPGEYLYSNLGYMTLGAIVESIEGRDWEDAIAADLFKPLGMTQSGFGPPGTTGRVDQPWGHTRQLDAWWPVQGDNAVPLGPAGRVHCPCADWAAYIAWTLRADVGDTPLLSRATQADLLTPSAGTYAAGWEITKRDWAGGRVLVHSGDNTLWHCVTWLAPKKGFAVLAATNSSSADVAKVCDDLASALIRWHQEARKP